MKELFEAGIIAIPLKYQEESPVQLQPNFFVVDSQFGIKTSLIPNLSTMIPEPTACSNMHYKLVYREILPAKYGKPVQFIERQLQQTELQDTPVIFFSFLNTLQNVIDNAATINAIFSLFQFRGVLDGLVMEVDVERIEEHLSPPEV